MIGGYRKKMEKKKLNKLKYFLFRLYNGGYTYPKTYARVQ